MPSRTLRVNVRRAEALIFAVVPFDEVPIDFGPGTKAGQLAGAGGALQRAGKDPREFQSLEPFSQAPGVTFSARRQRQIGEAGVLAAVRPAGLALPGQVDHLKSVHWLFSHVGLENSGSL